MKSILNNTIINYFMPHQYTFPDSQINAALPKPPANWVTISPSGISIGRGVASIALESKLNP